MKNEYDYLNDVKMDFSVYGGEFVSEGESGAMKKNIKGKGGIKRRAVIIAAAAAVAVTGTAFASGFAETIIKQLSTGGNTVVQYDPNEALELPEVLQGKFFDRNGVALAALKESDFDELYDADGNKLGQKEYADIVAEAYGGEARISEDGKVEISLKSDKDLDDNEHDFASADEAAAQASFDVKLPERLPEGYALDRVYTYTKENGDYTGDYVTLEYKNGKDVITIYERVMNDDTRFTVSTPNEIGEVDINGVTAVTDGDHGISWETDGMSVTIQTPESMTRADMLDFARGVK